MKNRNRIVAGIFAAALITGVTGTAANAAVAPVKKSSVTVVAPAKKSAEPLKKSVVPTEWLRVVSPKEWLR